MIDGFDVGAMLRGGVRDHHHALEFVEAFAAAWCSPLAAGDGYAEAEITAAEQRLGVRLPLTLREPYAVFGRRCDLNYRTPKRSTTST
jgi:hypothetical protein